MSASCSSNLSNCSLLVYCSSSRGQSSVIDLRRVLWSLALLFAFGGAQAQPLIVYTQNGGSLNGGSINSAPHSWRSFMGAGSPAGSVIVRDAATARLGGANVPMALARTIPWGAVAELSVRALPTVAIGVALWDIWDNLRTRPDGGGGGGLSHDGGQAQQETSAWCGYTKQTPAVVVCAKTAPEATQIIRGTYPLINGNLPNMFGCTGSATVYNCRAGYGADNSYEVSGTSVEAIVQTQCPAWVDFSNPLQSGPAGQPVGYDGKCRTGRYDPISAAAAKALFEASADKARAPEAVRDAVGAGVDATPYASAPGIASGPSANPSSPTTTTTTAPGGATTTTTTNSTQNITYNNNTYNYSTTVVTVTNSGAGDTTTTTTTDGPAAAPGEQKTDCDKVPDSVGCTKLGEPPTGDPMWEPKAVTYTEDSLGLPAGCPPSRNLGIRGWAMVLNYQPLCDVAPTVKLAVLAITALSCMFVVVSALKQ